MSWARFDDRYDDHRKIKRAWKRHPRAVGLHAMAITYSTRHHTDGLIDIEWLEEKLPSKVEREKVLVVLLATSLFERVDDEHFQIHDFLEYNESRDEREAARAEERARKAAAGRKGGLAKAANAGKKAKSGGTGSEPSASSDLAPASPLPGEAPSSPSSASVARTAPHRTAPSTGASPPVDGDRVDQARQRIQGASIQRVFDAWVTTAGKDPKRTVLDDKRRKLIRRALETYPEDEVTDAVRGWRRSAHHRGENDRETVYNDLSLLLRTGENIERFRDLERHHDSQTPATGADPDALVAAAEAWRRAQEHQTA